MLLSSLACLVVNVLATRQDMLSSNPNSRMDFCSVRDSTSNGGSGQFSLQSAKDDRSGRTQPNNM